MQSNSVLELIILQLKSAAMLHQAALSITSKITESVSTKGIFTNCFLCFSDYIAKRILKGPVLDWRWLNESFTGMVEKFGRKESQMRVPRFLSRFPAKLLLQR